MNNAHFIFRSGRHLFEIMCVCLALYMTGLQTQKFFDNEDTPSITFETFNSSPEKKYPTFTVCLRSYSGVIFNETYLLNTFGISGKTYTDYLMGSSVDENDLQIISEIDYDMALIQPSKFIVRIETKQPIPNVPAAAQKHPREPNRNNSSQQTATTR